MATVTPLDTDMSAWAPVTRHYQSGSKYLAVTVDAGVPESVAGLIDQTLTAMGQPALKAGRYTVVTNPTVILECREDGSPIDLTPEHISPAGTSHEDALKEMGYDLA